jgi:hypothetical protein
VLRTATILFALALSTACATHPKTVATRPVIKRIAVIPASNPKVSTDADAILHVRISEVGLYSSGYSRNYIPRVNASGKLFVRGQEDNVYDDDLCYGVDAKKGKEWAILPDAKYAYPSFDAVMTRIEEVRSSFADGTSAISARMSGQTIDSIKDYHAGAPTNR